MEKREPLDEEVTRFSDNSPGEFIPRQERTQPNEAAPNPDVDRWYNEGRSSLGPDEPDVYC